jgi:DNA-binding NtrC family response regulator
MQTPQHLVLIDDDPGVLRALALLLKTLGFSVTPFSVPADALTYIETGAAIDLVVTDLRMPELSGEAVLRRIRAYNSKVPVVIMSGHATPQEMSALQRQGASGFIPKPFTPAHFKTALSGLIQEHGHGPSAQSEHRSI